MIDRDMLPSLWMCGLLVIASGWMMNSHLGTWRSILADESKEPYERNYRRRQFHRRPKAPVSLRKTASARARLARRRACPSCLPRAGLDCGTRRNVRIASSAVSRTAPTTASARPTRKSSTTMPLPRGVVSASRIFARNVHLDIIPQIDTRQ